MFPCPTCEVKLSVKDAKLVGAILACPKCGSMVLVSSAEGAPTPPVSPTKTVRKRFPDALSHETSSGIIGPISAENRKSDLVLEIASPDDDVIEAEVKTRKILIGILIGLVIFLLVVLGYLMLVGEPQPYHPQLEAPPPIQDPNIVLPPQVPPQAPPEVPPEPPQMEPVPEFVDLSPITLPGEFIPKPINGEQIDFLPNIDTNIDDWSSDFIDLSVPNIDIDEHLALPIHGLHLDQTRLIDFIRTMSGLTGIPMTLDIDEMKARGVSAHTPMSGLFSEATAGEILTEALGLLNLQWIATDRQILVSPMDVADAVDLTFDVSDLVENTNDLTAEVLAEMIRKLVLPGGDIVVLPDNRLTVARERYAVLRLLEQLRFIRNLPQQTELMPEAVAPEAFGWDRVMQPMTFNHFRPIPLARMITQLEYQTGLTILVDHQSLHRSFTSFASVYATVQSDDGTVNDVMELLLSSVDTASLAYRIIDHQTLEMTTADAARLPKKMVMEVHHFQQLEGETPEDVVWLLRSAIAPDSWMVEDLPETRYGGNIVIDVPSGLLLIRQSQPVHRQIRLYLSESGLLEP